MVEQVKKWNEVAGREFPTSPTPISMDKFTGFCKLVIEENTELMAALKEYVEKPSNATLADVFDAIADSFYVQMGLILAMGFDPEQVVKVVTDSNNSKFESDVEVAVQFAAENGYKVKPTEDNSLFVFYDAYNKIRKGPNYQPPNWEQFFKDLNFDLNYADEKRSNL